MFSERNQKIVISFRSFQVFVSETEIAETELEVLPPYLRFHTLKVDDCGDQSIVEKIEWIKRTLRPHLQQLLNGSTLQLKCIIDQDDPSFFANFLMLFNHIENELLPICNASNL